MTFQTVKLRKNPGCKVCGSQPTITELIDYEAFCGVPARDDHAGSAHPEFDIEPWQLAAKLRQGEKVRLVDVREPVELQVSSLPGADNLPLGHLATRLNELDPSEEIVVFCRTGVRSGRALEILASAGFKNVKNLRGGINSWATDVDPAVLQY